LTDDPTTTTRAPSLPELRATLEAALRAYPELRQGLAHGLASVQRALGAPPPPPRRDRRRAGRVR